MCMILFVQLTYNRTCVYLPITFRKLFDNHFSNFDTISDLVSVMCNYLVSFLK